MCPAHAVRRAPPRPPYAARRLQWAGRPVSCRSGADALPCATPPRACVREHRAPASDPAAWQALAAPCVHAARPSGSLLVDRIRHATALVRRCTLDEPGRTPRLLEKASPPLGLPRRGVRGPAALGAPRALDRRAARAAVAQRSAAGRLHVRPRRADAAEERAPPTTFDAYVWASALYGIRARFCVAPRGARLCTRDALRVLDAPGVCVGQTR